MRRAIALAASIIGVATLVTAASPPLPRLVWNASASVPIGLYRIELGHSPKVGDIALVQPPEPLAQFTAERRYLPRGVPMLKHVAALAGSGVCRAGFAVTMNGQLAAMAEAQDHAGRPLPAWQGCRRLSAGEVFLLNPATPSSFDGRYFGVLPLGAVIGIAHPLWTWGSTRLKAIALFLATTSLSANPLHAAPPSPAGPSAAPDFAAIEAEASLRFGLPVTWIDAVLQAESAGDPGSVSPKGAMGLMQLMPQTWQELRDSLGVGSDPFDPHDNILAGAAYLRALHDRYGVPGFLAAYNAGPARWEQHLLTGEPLPLETRAYVDRLAPIIRSAPMVGESISSPVVDVDAASLFPRTTVKAMVESTSSHTPTDGIFVHAWRSEVR